MELGAEENQELSNKLYLKKIDSLVFVLSGFKERTRQTKILKTAKMSSVSLKSTKKSH
jgi:hypothetical protein